MESFSCPLCLYGTRSWLGFASHCLMKPKGRRHGLYSSRQMFIGPLQSGLYVYCYPAGPRGLWGYSTISLIGAFVVYLHEYELKRCVLQQGPAPIRLICAGFAWRLIACQAAGLIASSWNFVKCHGGAQRIQNHNGICMWLLLYWLYSLLLRDFI